VENEVAIAFGLPPESVVPIDDDEELGSGPCQACADWAVRFRAVEHELAACRREAEQYQKQIEALVALLPEATRP
jgi:hypothetical protein